MTTHSSDAPGPDPATWRSYNDTSAGLDINRLPGTSLDGTELTVALDDGAQLSLRFSAEQVHWSATGEFATASALSDPYDAVRVRPDVLLVHIPVKSRERESICVVYSESTHRAAVVRSELRAADVPGEPRVTQRLWAATTDGGTPSGAVPAPSRDLIGRRAVYRYSPNQLYEHVYLSSERYAWQCLQGAQRGHGDMDLSTVWKFDDGLYLFCFCEFRAPVGTVWLHDLGDALRTTGAFLGMSADGQAEHAHGGAHITPLGSVHYPDVQPV